MAAPQRYPDGVTNIGRGKTLSEMPTLDPTRLFGYFNDFYTYVATDWVVTNTNTGTVALSDTAVGGDLVITTDTAEQDAYWIQMSKDGGTSDCEAFLFAVGKKAWFKSRFKIDDIDVAEYLVGLHIADTDPSLSLVSDGIWFESMDAVLDVDFVIAKGSSQTKVSGICTMADDTYITLGFYWDGIDTVHYFVDDVEKGSVYVGTSLPDTERVAVSFGVEAGSGAASVMNLDYIGAWMER